jgi:2-dehydro-3-deoxygluconokinase
MEKYPKCKLVANTFRFDRNGNDILYYTSLFKDGELYSTPDFTCQCVVDRSGSGDCFMAGLIYGLTKELPAQELLEYATAAAFGKLQEQGDATSNDALSVIKIKKEQV